MAEKSEKPAAGKAEEIAEGSAPAKKGGSGKIILIVVAMMAVQTAGIIGVLKATGPKVAEAKVEVQTGPQEDTEATVEIPLVEERFQNLQSGRVWIWDTEIVLQVKAKHAPAVTGALEQRGAEIREGVARIFRQAQHNQLREPGLETINRQLLTFLNESIGKDAENQERVRRVLIPRCKGFPAD